MDDINLKRKSEDFTGGALKKKKYGFMAIGLNSLNPECLQLIDDASEAIVGALKKIEALENYLQQLKERTVTTGQDSKHSVISKFDEHSPADCSGEIRSNESEFQDNKACDTSIKEPGSNQDQQIDKTDEDINGSLLLNISAEDSDNLNTFVTNIKKGISVEELTSILEEADLHEFTVCVVHRNNHSFAFVKYKDKDNYNKALSLNRKLVSEGQKITIRVCGPKRSRNKINKQQKAGDKLNSLTESLDKSHESRPSNDNHIEYNNRNSSSDHCYKPSNERSSSYRHSDSFNKKMNEHGSSWNNPEFPKSEDNSRDDISFPMSGHIFPNGRRYQKFERDGRNCRSFR